VLHAIDAFHSLDEQRALPAIKEVSGTHSVSGKKLPQVWRSNILWLLVRQKCRQAAHMRHGFFGLHFVDYIPANFTYVEEGYRNCEHYKRTLHGTPLFRRRGRMP